MNNSTEVAFIIVNFNTVDLLENCLHSIRKHTALAYKIIVVDNNSTDGSREMVKQKFPAVFLIENSENVGFPKAVNQGLKAITAAFYFIVNSDIVLLENSPARLHEYLQENPRTGIAAPAQFTPDGQPVLAVHPFPTLWREWTRNIFFTDVWQYRLMGKKQARKFKKPMSVDWVMGAALFVRSELIAEIGLMDEAIFMYGEELDWCYRATLGGWSIDFVPQAKIIHHKGASADKAFHFHRYRLVVRSNYYFFAKHFGLARLPFFVLAQLIGSGLRLLLAFALCVIGKKEFCYQAREHREVLRAAFDLNEYRGIKASLRNG